MNPYTTAAILLACTTAILPAATVNVVLLAGQSNAGGRPSSTGLPASALDAGIEYYYDFVDSASNNSGNAFVPLAPINNTFGPEMTMGRALVQSGISNLAIVKTSNGGTSIFNTTQWAPGGDSTSLYNQFITTTTNAMTAITTRGDTINLLGIAWQQGERDATTGRTTAEYQAQLNTFIASVRSDLNTAVPGAGFDTLKFFIGGVPNVADGVNGQSASAYSSIRAAQVDVANADPRSVFIDTSSFGLASDNLHFDAPGQIALGNAYAAAIIPEPTACFLLIIGCIALGAKRKRPQ